MADKCSVPITLMVSDLPWIYLHRSGPLIRVHKDLDSFNTEDHYIAPHGYVAPTYPSSNSPASCCEGRTPYTHGDLLPTPTAFSNRPRLVSGARKRATLTVLAYPEVVCILDGRTCMDLVG